MEKPSVSLLNVVTDAHFPTASDLPEDFVLAEPGQNFKALVLLKRLSSIVWPEGFTHLRVSGRLDGEFDMHSRFIRRQDLAATVANGEVDDVQAILDGLMELGILYSERHRPSFSEAVVLQHTDSTSWTSQAGTVEIGVEAVKLVHAPGRQLVRSESAVVKRGTDCKIFHNPGLRVVPGVSVCHSEGAPKLEEGQQAVARVKESAIVMPRPAWHSYYESCSLASVTVKYDSEKNVNLRRINTEQGLAAGHKFVGQRFKRPRSSAKPKKPAKKGYREVCIDACFVCIHIATLSKSNPNKKCK